MTPSSASWARVAAALQNLDSSVRFRPAPLDERKGEQAGNPLPLDFSFRLALVVAPPRTEERPAEP